MKIVCDSCGAKYSIADEKVAGKVFKIRCKKCSAVIVVRGDQVADEQPTAVAGGGGAAAAGYDYGSDAVWHVVVDGDQQGPFAPAQIGEMLSAGTIDWEVYVWREGFDGWLAARDVPELVEAVTGQSQQGQAPAQEEPAAAAYGGGAAMGADPFGGQSQDAGFGGGGGYGDQGGYGQEEQQDYGAQSGGMFGGYGESQPEVASRATHDAGADLFAQSDASQSPFGGADAGGDDDVVASQPSPRVGADQASMTGQRNENSVLFSLSNLQALATGSGGSASPAAAPVASSAAASARPGHASGEGSGLIDIRALAGATGGSGGGAPREERANADDLLSIGTGGLGGSLGAPVLAPVQEEKSNKGILIGAIAAAGVLAAALVIVVVVLVTKEPEPVAQASGAPNATGAGAVVPSTGTPSTPSGTEQPSQPSTAAQEASADEEEEEVEEEEEGSSGGGSRSRTASRRGRTGGGGGGGGSAPSAMEAEPASTGGGGGGGGGRSGGGSDIDSLLDQALGGGGGMATQMRAARETGGGGGGGADLPDTPPRDAVASALRSVAGPVAACGQGQHGVANTTVTVSGSTGRVTNAQVTGQFAGTPIGSCVARAVRGARFPRFRRPTFQVSFPYRL